ncbi:MAG TPA: protein kinase [Thermoanaerobaculia bacterium]|nr:protein kinase [Thermoanaerobaculia bacterium]
MPIAPGSRLGPYEVVAPIGAGGMGEVFKARDTRLERIVAVKILPADFAENPQLKLRFAREAKAISALNHPHICTLYDVGSESGFDFLVMEYLEGESLADRLGRGALPIEQVLKYGTQIASALEAAHRQGIVHRDLKPANVMITKGGAKLLDFGLAKPAATAISTAFSGTETAGPTEHRALTAEGTIIGTFQYMAPEQLEGAEADARTDIFALGTLLYEMATGRRAFDGKTKTSLIAAIVDREPPAISSIQPLTPPAFERLVKVCMAKDPDDRWQTAHDVLLQLRWIAEGGSQAGVAAPVTRRRRHREWTAWTLGALLVASTIFFAYQWRRAVGTPERRVELAVLPPEGTDLMTFAVPPTLSPDGTRLLIAARGEEGSIQLWVRRLDNGALQPLAGTASPGFPFWSPDGRFIAFFSEQKLRRLDSGGGPAQIVADAPRGRGGSWAPDGTILFSPTDRGTLHRVPATGGAVTEVTKLGPDETSHRYPTFLPDGKHFIYLATTASGDGRVLAGSLDGKVRKVLIEGAGRPLYSPRGYIIYVRDRALVARRFDADALEFLAAEPVLLADDVGVNPVTLSATYSVSGDSMLAYQKGANAEVSNITIVDRRGVEKGTVGSPADYVRPSLSHDGRKIVVELVDSQGNSDLWIHDLVRKTAARFTFDSGRETHAIWSPDDQWIAYLAEKEDRSAREARRARSNGAGSPEVLFTEKGIAFAGLTDWSADGRYLFFHATPSKGGALDAGYYSFESKKKEFYLQSAFADSAPRLSPDGRWLAYQSNESGKPEIMVQTFPSPSGKWQISTAGGSQPNWRADGKELYFMSADEKIMAVDIAAGTDSFEASVPEPLFAIRPKEGGWSYDCSPDGQTFVLNQPLTEVSPAPVTVVINWTEGLPE